MDTLLEQDVPINPADIELNYTLYDEVYTVTFGDLNDYYVGKLQVASIFGLRIGLAAAVLAVMYIITKNRKTPMFILNSSCLLVLLIHSIMVVCTLTQYLSSMQYMFTGIIYHARNATRTVAATNAVYILSVFLVECSITYQIYVIFKTPHGVYKYISYLVTLISGTLGLTTTAFYFAFCCFANMALYDKDGETTAPPWIANASLIMFSASSAVMSLMLLIKLGLAIRTRKHLGLKSFSIYHIIFIMCAQSMIFPTVIIFAGICDGNGLRYRCLYPLGTALITISLPITSLWANASNNQSTASSTIGTILSSPSPTSFESRSYYSDDDKSLSDTNAPYDNWGQKMNVSSFGINGFSQTKNIHFEDEDMAYEPSVENNDVSKKIRFDSDVASGNS
ncbi:unnamed protein product [[Candida] boidinii]|uniref:Unnamed protein product n=1 Tax=Candida boidinii TaxID=5477 RepID=A0ACB5TRY3_CANBO|nr:unnamed protein product [[Candida] boidinii]